MQGPEYFRKLTNEQLNHAIADIKAALETTGNVSIKDHDKYMDQLTHATTEKARREGGGCCPTCGRKWNG